MNNQNVVLEKLVDNGTYNRGAYSKVPEYYDRAIIQLHEFINHFVDKAIEEDIPYSKRINLRILINDILETAKKDRIYETFHTLELKYEHLNKQYELIFLEKYKPKENI
jgi:hypothetical protein